MIVLFCCCMLFALVQLLTEEGSFAPISCFRWRSWLSYGFPKPCGRFFCSLYIIWGYSPGYLCSLSHCGPTRQPHFLICICLGFHSLRFHPIFEPGLVFWIFFFLTLSTLLYVWSNSNISHHKCHAIMTEIPLLLE